MGNSDVFAPNSYTNIKKNTENSNLSSIPVDEMKGRPESPEIATHQVQRLRHLGKTPNS